MKQPPSQPSEKAWHFVRELQAPMRRRACWSRFRPRANEVDLSKGVCVVWEFPDPEGLIETARADFRSFLKEIALESGGRAGGYPIRFVMGQTAQYEAYRVVIAREGCEVIASDTEGIRRAVYFLEDEILRAEGPFLQIGTIEREPVIRTRISRCFFGPINRPPKNRDELADEEDYYPPEYLNRLAHEGVNALWITICFRDLCPSRFFPSFGKDSDRRLKKLRETVNQCARYGIGIYAFCIEPVGFSDGHGHYSPNHYLKRHPELAGHQAGNITSFCTSSRKGQAYLEEAIEHLFSAVPGLAGLIDINMGERRTHCYSHLLADGANNCPRCSKRAPWEVIHDTLAAMRRGMNCANPRAELISWFYVPSILERRDRKLEELEGDLRRIAEHLPKEVTFQYNFESMGRTCQLGRERVVRDYSLAYVGPSEIFSECARVAHVSGVRVSAKLQVGCSHEVATVPCVPAPGNLFLKYQAMHRLGVSSAMQCWYFGNYPSLMTKAAGELSFAPFPHSESRFLEDLARPLWGKNSAIVAKAWSHFSAAYRDFPANLNFAWYGPVHDSVVWPLHLVPQDSPIAPSWLLGFPPSGDRIGECIGFGHTLPEILILCERMNREWGKGVKLLQSLKRSFRPGREQSLEIGLAAAMGLQISSTTNVMKFYALREDLLFNPEKPLPLRLRSLRELRRLVKKEIRNSLKLARLARRDSRLGFHSEAEGYKYFPEKLVWRANLLHHLLATDFEKVEGMVRAGKPLFPAYCGFTKRGKSYRCRFVAPSDVESISWEEIKGESLNAVDGEPAQWATVWKAVHDGSRYHFEIRCTTPPHLMKRYRPSADFFSRDYLVISVEPRRLWPTREFFIGPFGEGHENNKQGTVDPHWTVEVTRDPSGWRARVMAPFSSFGGEENPRLRINVERMIPKVGGLAWIEKHPLPPRLIFGTRNPKDLGWFEREG